MMVNSAMHLHVQEHYAKYEPTILELKRKYETAMKEKMLMSLEKDKVGSSVTPPASLPRGPAFDMPSRCALARSRSAWRW